MLNEIKISKERNLRHLHREELRKKIAAKRGAVVWNNEDAKDDEYWDWDDQWFDFVFDFIQMNDLTTVIN